MATTPTTPRTPRRDRQILQAAAELFYERGFHRVGVVEIGARIGISGPAIYRHFSSKDEILATLFNEAMDEIVVSGETLQDPRAELEALVRRQVDFALSRRELLSVFTHEERSLAAAHRRRFQRRMREHALHWERVLHRCYPAADERVLPAAVQGAFGLIHSVVFWPQSAMRAPGLGDVLFAQVLDGLGVLGTGRAPQRTR